jgi:hypothetical protein
MRSKHLCRNVAYGVQTLQRDIQRRSSFLGAFPPCGLLQALAFLHPTGNALPALWVIGALKDREFISPGHIHAVEVNMHIQGLANTHSPISVFLTALKFEKSIALPARNVNRTKQIPPRL